MLAIWWGGLAALRIGFLMLHVRDFEGLWSDYARGGFWFRTARALDYITLGIFLVVMMRALWGIDERTADGLGRVFVAWLGFLLLKRLPIHRFPRTNLPGAFAEAQFTLAVHCILSVLGALGATILTWIVFWWRR